MRATNNFVPFINVMHCSQFRLRLEMRLRFFLGLRNRCFVARYNGAGTRTVLRGARLTIGGKISENVIGQSLLSW
jgi:hypothetical protein